MRETLEAIYENGMFRPLTRPSGIGEYHRVTLTVTDAEAPVSLADLSGRISTEDGRELRAIVLREFDSVDPREWR